MSDLKRTLGGAWPEGGEVVTRHMFGGPVTSQPPSGELFPTNLFELAEAGMRCLATAQKIDPGPNWETFARDERTRATYRAIQAAGMAAGVRWTLMMLGFPHA